MMILKILISFLILNLYACSTSQEALKSREDFNQQLEQTRAKITQNDEKQEQQSYIKVLSVKKSLLNQKISHFTADSLSLREILNLILPDAYIIIEGENVDLNQILSINSRNLNYEEFLELLSSKSSYRISLEKSNKLLVSSVAYRRWNVAAMVSLPQVRTSIGNNATADNVSNSTEITISKIDQTWDDLLTGLRNIIDGGVIVDNRRLGEIYASGDPNKLILADQWMKKIVESSTRQVLLDVAILEVTLNDDETTGLDWNAVYTKNSANSIEIGRSAKQTPGAGAWSFIANYASGKIKLTAMIDLLKKHGKVSVQHEPSLTVTNGSTAYLGSSEQFSYLAGVTRDTQTSNGIVETTITPDIQEINIGVNIAVTARLLDGDDILIEVVPVISSLQGFNEITFSGTGNQETLNTPRITLQELSTQVITKSGQSIHLGGLVIEKIIERSSKTPIASKLLQLFNSQSQELEKREILIIITPTEV